MISLIHVHAKVKVMSIDKINSLTANGIIIVKGKELFTYYITLVFKDMQLRKMR